MRPLAPFATRTWLALVLILLPARGLAAVDAHVERSVLAGEWLRLDGALSEPRDDESPVLRTIRAHAHLAANRNNAPIARYTAVMREVAAELEVGFAEVFSSTQAAMADDDGNLTFNGAHLTEEGYARFADILYERVFQTFFNGPGSPLKILFALFNARGLILVSLSDIEHALG